MGMKIKERGMKIKEDGGGVWGDAGGRAGVRWWMALGNAKVFGLPL